MFRKFNSNGLKNNEFISKFTIHFVDYFVLLFHISFRTEFIGKAIREVKFSILEQTEYKTKLQARLLE